MVGAEAEARVEAWAEAEAETGVAAEAGVGAEAEAGSGAGAAARSWAGMAGPGLGSEEASSGASSRRERLAMVMVIARAADGDRDAVTAGLAI